MYTSQVFAVICFCVVLIIFGWLEFFHFDNGEENENDDKN